MQVERLDHVNIVTADLDRAEAFYRDVLELKPRPAPPPLTHQAARWMHDANGVAMLHLNSLDAPRHFDRDLTPGPTGALTVALRCSGYDEMIAKIAATGLSHQRNIVEAIGLRQIFVVDPDGVLLELNFFGD